MGRPRKYADAALDEDLRIPVTQEQKLLIQDAVKLDGLDMAAWARKILLVAAQDRIDREKPIRSGKQKGKSLDVLPSES